MIARLSPTLATWSRFPYKNVTIAQEPERSNLPFLECSTKVFSHLSKPCFKAACISSGKLYLIKSIPFLLRYINVEVIPQKISTVYTTMPIKHTKICGFLPFRTIFRFSYVQYDSNTIFVIPPNWPLISRSRISFNKTIRFEGMLGFLEIRYRYQMFYHLWPLIVIRCDVSKVRNLQRIFYFNLMLNYFLGLLRWGFWLRARLVLVLIS